MRTVTRTLVVAALLLVPASPLRAQPAADPSGHWEGAIQVPNMEMRIEIDLAKNAAGKLAGTFGQPAQTVRGLPLSSVAVDNRSITLVLKAGPDPSTFEGTLSEDGKSMSGTVAQAGKSAP